MSLELLAEALSNSLNPDEAIRRPIEDQLKQWETTPGFYSSLLELVSMREQVGVTVRIQAILYFKNGLDKYWRKTSSNAITKDQKAIIRPRLMSLLDEPNNTIASAITYSIGKIARLDYDADWPTLPNELLESISLSLSGQNPAGQSGLVLQRSLSAVQETVELLTTNRMPRGRKLMQQIGPILFSPLRNLYEQMATSWMNELSSSKPASEDLHKNLQLSLLIFKTLRGLLAYGWMDMQQHSEPKEFYFRCITYFSSVQSLRVNLLNSTEGALMSARTHELLGKHVLSFGKLFIDVKDIDGSQQAVFDAYWRVVNDAAARPDQISDTLMGMYPEALLVQSFRLIRTIIISWPSTEHPPFSPTEEALLAQLVDWSKTCVGLLVMHFIPMRQTGMILWADDPEEYLHEEESDREDFDLRPAALRLCSDLVNQFRAVVGPEIIKLLMSDNIRSPQTDAEWKIKEALYCALGRNPTDVIEALSAQMPLDRWISEVLIPEAMGDQPLSTSLLRPRIMSLFGSWIGEEMSTSSRSLIYQSLVHFLQALPNSTLGTRLSAARSLGKCDTWGFELEAFLPFLDDAVKGLVKLMEECDMIESRMRLMQTLGTLIGAVGQQILPYAGQLFSILPSLWASAEGQTLFKVSILAIVEKLTEAIGEQSQSIHPQIAELVAYSVNPASAEYAYLHEEAIELWRICLRFSTSLTTDIANLLPYLAQLLQSGADTLPNALKILESYLLLDGDAVLSTVGRDIAAAFESMLDADLKFEAVKMILHAFDMMVQKSSSWPAYLEGSGCFAKLLMPLTKNESALILSKYLASLARIVVADTQAFYGLLKSTATVLSTTSNDLLQLVLRQWIDLHDNVGSASQRKLVALALAYLTPTTDPTILSRLPDLMTIWSGVLAETEESQTGDAEAYALMDAYESEGEYEAVESSDTRRRAALRETDPVHCLGLRDVISSKLNEAHSLNGGLQGLQQHFAQADPLIMEELMKRLRGELKG